MRRDGFAVWTPVRLAPVPSVYVRVAHIARTLPCPESSQLSGRCRCEEPTECVPRCPQGLAFRPVRATLAKSLSALEWLVHASQLALSYPPTEPICFEGRLQ